MSSISVECRPIGECMDRSAPSQRFGSYNFRLGWVFSCAILLFVTSASISGAWKPDACLQKPGNRLVKNDHRLRASLGDWNRSCGQPRRCAGGLKTDACEPAHRMTCSRSLRFPWLVFPQTHQVHAFLRSWAHRNLDEEVAESIRIIYGGSIDPDNCYSLAECRDVDGFLVGAASLDSDTFLEICKCKGSLPMIRHEP